MESNVLAAIAARHISVLLDRCLELLEPAVSRPGAVVIDATLGMGGHAFELLRRHPELRLIGLDRDPQALELARIRLAEFANRVDFYQVEYDQIAEVLAELDLPAVDAVLFDLGVSSLQLDEADRGFSYNQAAPLDMRMNQSDSLSASEVVNTYSEAEIATMLREYADEKFAHRIARAIVQARTENPIEDTATLAELVKNAIPAATRRTGGHPAKRTFQAIRIEVNSELDILRNAIPAALAAVNVGGRVVVMSYQSLEDRIVKNLFSEATACEAPLDMPIVPVSMQPEFAFLIRGAEQAGEKEIDANPRSSSVRLRAVERMRAAA
jgi:16S rRNA (cytosine1402-N4)-methyltransferase